jgi:hypothetical protein
MKKTLGFALFLLLIIPLPAMARTIWLKAAAEDGSQLSVFTNAEPITKNGWTVFQYGIGDGDSLKTVIGVTTYCTNGKIQKSSATGRPKLPIPTWANANEIASIKELSTIVNLSRAIKKPGWIEKSDNIISANTPGNREVLATVCRVANTVAKVIEQ